MSCFCLFRIGETNLCLFFHSHSSILTKISDSIEPHFIVFINMFVFQNFSIHWICLSCVFKYKQNVTLRKWAISKFHHFLKFISSFVYYFTANTCVSEYVSCILTIYFSYFLINTASILFWWQCAQLENSDYNSLSCTKGSCNSSVQSKAFAVRSFSCHRQIIW